MSVTSVGYEPFVAARFLRARLIQNVNLAAWVGTDVYNTVAPSGKTKYVLMTLVSAEDLIYVGGLRVWSNQLWQIEAWSRTNDDAVVAEKANWIDAELHGATGSTSGSAYGSGIVWDVQRERALLLPPDVDGDVIWRRAGGEYRLHVKGS